MDDKVVRYVVLSVAVVSWFLLLFLIYQAFQKISVDSSVLTQLFGVVQGLAIAAGSFLFGRSHSKAKTPPAGGTNP